MQKMVGEERPLLRENLAKTGPHIQKHRFPINICLQRLNCNTEQKSSIITNRKYTMRLPMCLRWTVLLSLNPQRGLKNAKLPFFVQKIWTIDCDNFETVRDRRSVCINH